MIAQCPTCEARYRVDDSKVNLGGTKFKCKKCKNTFTVFREIQQHEQKDPVLRAPTTKNCPHCGKPIPFQAVKCRYCREAVDKAVAGAGFEGQEAQVGEGLGEHHDPFVPQGGPGEDHQDPFVPQSGPGEEHHDPFVPQGGPGADHQDPFVPQGAGGYSGQNAFDEDGSFRGSASGYGAPALEGGYPGGHSPVSSYSPGMSVSGKRINPGLFAGPFWGGVTAIMIGAVKLDTGQLGLWTSLLGLAGFALLFFSLIYGWVALFRSWAVIPASSARTTPGKAVGFMFIPFFNLYWIFVSVKGLAEDANEFVIRSGRRYGTISEGLSLAYCIVVILGLFIPFLPFVSFVIQTVLVYQWAGFVNSLVNS